MGNIGHLFTIGIINPITNVLLAIYHLLVYLHVPSPLGFSIILLTVVVRFVLYPLTASQMKAAKKMQTIAPHVSKLKEQHKNDSQKLQQETMALYKEHGVNPAAGCVPVLIQLPMIWGLYNVLQHIVSLQPGKLVSTINAVAYTPSLRLQSAWDTHFFGLSLAASPAKLFSSVGIIVILIPLLTALFQFLQTKMMTPADQEIKPKTSEPDFATAFQTQSMYMFPLMIGYFSFQFPLGLSLYWNTFTIFGMIQQYKMTGLGSLSTLLKKWN